MSTARMLLWKFLSGSFESSNRRSIIKFQILNILKRFLNKICHCIPRFSKKIWEKRTMYLKETIELTTVRQFRYDFVLLSQLTRSLCHFFLRMTVVPLERFSKIFQSFSEYFKDLEYSSCPCKIKIGQL